MKTMKRYQLTIYGAVQGIGFRPFFYRLAHQMGIVGQVSNIPQGVIAEIEGTADALDIFIKKIETEKPALASIYSIEVIVLDPFGYSDFQIRHSSANGSKQAIILPDIATCPDCLKELFDPSDRRYLYPFTNCTNCGPRWTIMESLPYDRTNTSMKRFTMCPDCQHEYDDPANRRFHAQPNACPSCGPTVRLITNSGKYSAEHTTAIREAVDALRHGSIVAVKGIGGFHLMADPFSDSVLGRLRERKHREEKPFALMMPSIEYARQYCSISEKEEQALLGTAAPIVLVHRRERNSDGEPISKLIAPNNPFFGIMLPYTPLHYIMMQQLGRPLIATSGNLTDEPICIDDHDAFNRLGHIADLFLLHNRPIIRHVDDSILRIIGGREAVLRRGRGFAPLPVRLESAPQRSYLAVGAHLKNSIAMNAGASVFVSQHIGDLETEQSLHAFTAAIHDFKEMYEITPDVVVADFHPDYLSTTYAQQQPIPLHQIQHHEAHVFSCMAENHLLDDVFGVSWDGTGYGNDSTIWGGEFFSWKNGEMKRRGTFRSFPLPGGSIAVKEPRRSALGLLFEMTNGNASLFADLSTIAQFPHHETETIWRMMENKLNAPRTSSVGRLFDAVSSLIGMRQKIAYEGQAALELESLTEQGDDQESYPFEIDKANGEHFLQVINWKEMILGIISDSREKISASMIAQKFHNTLCEIIVAMAEIAGQQSVVLSGGCFQNAYLTERAISRLKENGFTPYWHQRIPPNDGGISLGQLYGAILLEDQKLSKQRERICASQFLEK